jgi:hypothetical protein
MVEKRQADKETSTPVHRDIVGDSSREDASLEHLPGGLSSLKLAPDQVASELLELAERQVAEARRKLGSDSTKPRLKRLEEMFEARSGREPGVSPDLERTLRSNVFVPQVATLDSTYDHTVATAYNIFDKISVQTGASVQASYDDWQLAVRIYKSEMRAAGAILEAGVEIAAHPNQPVDYDYDTQLRAEAQVSHFTKSDKIATALLTYEKRMQQAASDLSRAYGLLITSLYGAANGLGVAEATLISSIQSASKSFWTGVQNAIGQVRN